MIAVVVSRCWIDNQSVDVDATTIAFQITRNSIERQPLCFTVTTYEDAVQQSLAKKSYNGGDVCG